MEHIMLSIVITIVSKVNTKIEIFCPSKLNRANFLNIFFTHFNEENSFIRGFLDKKYDF